MISPGYWANYALQLAENQEALAVMEDEAKTRQSIPIAGTSQRAYLCPYCRSFNLIGATCSCQEAPAPSGVCLL